jgi:hypothetical protein
MSCGGDTGFSRTVLPFNAGMLGPQIAVALVTSSGRPSQFKNVPARSAVISFESGGEQRNVDRCLIGVGTVHQTDQSAEKGTWQQKKL